MSDTLNKLRLNINSIDNQIIKLLESRMKLCKQVGEYKKEHNLQVYSKSREEEVINRISSNSNLDSNFIKNLWNLIMNYSKDIQNK